MKSKNYSFSYHQWSESNYTAYFTCPECGKIKTEELETLDQDVATHCLNYPLKCPVTFHITRDQIMGKRVDADYLVEFHESS